MSDCNKLQDRVLESGTEAATETPELRAHLEQCAECQRFVEDVQTLTHALKSPPAVDAPDELVEKTARRVRETKQTRAAPKRHIWRPRYWYSVAASILVMGFVVLLMQPSYQRLSTMPETEIAAQAPTPDALDNLSEPEAQRDFARQRALEEYDDQLSALEQSEQLLGELSRSSGETGDFAGLYSFFGNGESAGQKRRARRSLLEGNEAKQNKPSQPSIAGARALMDERRKYELPTPKENGGRTDAGRLQLPGLATLPATPPTESEEAYRESEDAPLSSVTQEHASAETETQLRQAPSKGENGTREKARSEIVHRAAQKSLDRGLAGAGTVTGSFADFDAEGQASARAAAFLAALESVEGLSFQEPRGYWRNTYIPGDSAMRLLRTRLGLWRQVPEIGDVRLEGAARANRQPLDVPDNAAMGLYLQADKAAVSGVERVRLQVGLQGAVRKGSRPTMNVSVVVNLSDAAIRPTVQQVRALVTAFARARQPGDRFTLTASGVNGGLLVDADNFRHGPLQVALERMFSGQAPEGAALNLTDAVQVAAQAARSGDDPNAVFGSSLVLIITSGIVDAQLPTLQAVAHQNAVGGIALSVVDTSAGGVLGARSAALERLVAAGQGQRRSMANVDDAARIINAELHAASRAVARAARLRVRLAPGVQLIDVLGSQRLAEPQAERVREAEQSIDQRLARNLGIRADRGEDEDGIQIVIPNFYAGDSHVILLDLLVAGPGSVADVTLRYKDLVHLKNGVARAELRLASGERSPGPLQRNVLKNRVAFELAQAARRASQFLTQGDGPSAINTLQSMHDLLTGLREAVSGWSSDQELLADTRLVADYVAYLQANLQTHPFHQRYLVESLRYMAFRKLTATNEEPQP